MAKKESIKSIESISHEVAQRKNIPTTEYQSVMQKEEERAPSALPLSVARQG